MIARRHGGSEEGFTLVELLIVCVVTPLIVGGLAIGLLSVFSLQSSVSNRLGDTGDSQVVAANFATDVQSAVGVTTAPYLSSTACEPSNQVTLVGFRWGLSATVYQDYVYYDDVANGSTYNLVRYSCTEGPSNTPTSSTIISYNVLAPCTAVLTTNCQGTPTIYPNADATNASTGWQNTKTVTKVEFNLAEPNRTEKNGAYQYTLAGIPADYAAVEADGGAPAGPTSAAGCFFATPGTGEYASTMCLVDFSSLTGNNLLAAEQGVSRCRSASRAAPRCTSVSASRDRPSLPRPYRPGERIPRQLLFRFERRTLCTTARRSTPASPANRPCIRRPPE
jgi:type II secretory pathway pseudopilin PulG